LFLWGLALDKLVGEIENLKKNLNVFSRFFSTKISQGNENSPKKIISVPHPELAVFIFLVRIFAAWKQPKKPVQLIQRSFAKNKCSKFARF
jgi:hypothetical protein